MYIPFQNCFKLRLASWLGNNLSSSVFKTIVKKFNIRRSWTYEKWYSSYRATWFPSHYGLNYFNTIHLWHAEIGNDCAYQIVVWYYVLYSFCRILESFDLVSLVSKHMPYYIQSKFIIVYYENGLLIVYMSKNRSGQRNPFDRFHQKVIWSWFCCHCSQMRCCVSSYHYYWNFW